MRYWAQQAAELCFTIDDESLEPVEESLRKAIEEMNRDRRVVMIGAARSGKSTLLAGMVGVPVLARVASAYHYTRWRYMGSDADDSSYCRFLPEPNLFGMELVDTGACESPEVAGTVAPLLSEADVVVAVVDARSVELSPVWAYLLDCSHSCRFAGNCTGCCVGRVCAELFQKASAPAASGIPAESGKCCTG